MAIIKKSISLDEDLYLAATLRYKRLGIPGFSQYLTHLMERDQPPKSVAHQIKLALEDLTRALHALNPTDRDDTTTAIQHALRRTPPEEEEGNPNYSESSKP